jgi:hypothetical protein
MYAHARRVLTRSCGSAETRRLVVLRWCAAVLWWCRGRSWQAGVWRWNSWRRPEVDRWLQAYVEAWKSYDGEQIGDLFSEDVRYRYHPYDEPVVGRAELVRSWLGEASDGGAVADRDKPGTYDAAYRAVAVDGDVAVATGSSTYLSGPAGR